LDIRLAATVTSRAPPSPGHARPRRWAPPVAAKLGNTIPCRQAGQKTVLALSKCGRF
jgi:hypothetical protein